MFSLKADIEYYALYKNKEHKEINIHPKIIEEWAKYHMFEGFEAIFDVTIFSYSFDKNVLSINLIGTKENVKRAVNSLLSDDYCIGNMKKGKLTYKLVHVDEPDFDNETCIQLRGRIIKRVLEKENLEERKEREKMEIEIMSNIYDVGKKLKYNENNFKKLAQQINEEEKNNENVEVEENVDEEDEEDEDEEEDEEDEEDDKEEDDKKEDEEVILENEDIDSIYSVKVVYGIALEEEDVKKILTKEQLKDIQEENDNLDTFIDQYLLKQIKQKKHDIGAFGYIASNDDYVSKNCVLIGIDVKSYNRPGEYQVEQELYHITQKCKKCERNKLCVKHVGWFDRNTYFDLAKIKNSVCEANIVFKKGKKKTTSATSVMTYNSHIEPGMFDEILKNLQKKGIQKDLKFYYRVAIGY